MLGFAFADCVACPVGEGHVFFCRVCALVYDFCCSLAVGSPVHFILYCCEKELRCLGSRIVVDAGGVDVQYFAPEDFFRGAYVPDACQQLFEVVATARLLEPVVVEGKTLDDKFLQCLGRPYTKLRCLIAVYPISNSNDGVKVILSGLVTFAIKSSCFQNGNN